MKTEKEYSEMLIEQYNKIFCDNYKNQNEIVECAINDVQNTIEVLQRIDEVTFIDEYYFDYYNNVLNILKEKV